ncbi:MAG: hypothetical protein AAGE94_21830 [Acidobacteriota bacterium]
MTRKLTLGLTTAAASLFTAWWLGVSATHLDLDDRPETRPASLDVVPPQAGDVETAVFAVG